MYQRRERLRNNPRCLVELKCRHIEMRCRFECVETRSLPLPVLIRGRCTVWYQVATAPRSNSSMPSPVASRRRGLRAVGSPSQPANYPFLIGPCFLLNQPTLVELPKWQTLFRTTRQMPQSSKVRRPQSRRVQLPHGVPAFRTPTCDRIPPAREFQLPTPAGSDRSRTQTRPPCYWCRGARTLGRIPSPPPSPSCDNTRNLHQS